VKAEQGVDEFCKRIKGNLAQQQDYMIDEDGLLYYKNAEGTPRLVVPATLVSRIIRDHHDAKHAAHAGVRKTQQWVRQILLAQLTPRHRELYLELRPVGSFKNGTREHRTHGYVARDPGDVASIDITGPYATSERGNRYLLTYIDHFTKWAEAVPIPDQDATTVATALITQVFRTPRSVWKIPE
jgi:hypothetical protein